MESFKNRSVHNGFWLRTVTSDRKGLGGKEIITRVLISHEECAWKICCEYTLLLKTVFLNFL